MATPGRKISSCMVIQPKMIPGTERGSFLTCSRSRLKFSASSIAHLVPRSPKRAQEELLAGKSWAS
jgi:hypothetical protein